MVNFDFKEKYNIDDLLKIMTILRAPGGCPWDMEQTHETLKKDFIEETYEVIEAINKSSVDGLCEELGDVLLQVVFHSELEKEKGNFSFDDVCDGICKKMIVRHPHVFGDVKVESSDDVLKNWDEIKMKTKHQKTATESVESIPYEFPGLMYAQKVGKKAKKYGLDLPTECEDENVTESELAEQLFKICLLAEKNGIDSEQALKDYTKKYVDSLS